MRVPLLDLQAQLASIEPELQSAVLETVASGQFALGPKVTAFEKAIETYVGVEHAIGVSSGTDALLAALMALDVGSGDIVVTTPFTFFATGGVVSRLGARPEFVDITPDTYTMNPAALRAWFERRSASDIRPKAIIPVHLYGQCADMDAIDEVADAFGVPLIEDAAQALGAHYPTERGRKPAGTLGLMGCYSFYPTKNLGGIGDGGMIVTDDDALAVKLRLLRNHGESPRYHHGLIGGNFRLDALQAAALLVKLPRLAAWNDARRELAERYDAAFRGSAVSPPALAYDRACHCYHQYVITVPERRDALRAHLDQHEVGSQVYYPVPLHLQPCFRYLGYKAGAFPVSEHAASHTLALPMYPELSEAMQDYVIEQVLAFFN